MGCVKRMLIFVLGMVFGVVAFLGSLVGIGYWAYKNVNLSWLEKTFGFHVDLGEDPKGLKDMNLSEIIAAATDLAAKFPTMTVGDFETEFGVDISKLIGLELPEEAKALKFSELMSADGLMNVARNFKMSSVFTLVPGVFPEQVQSVIGERKLGILLDGDYGAMFEGVKMGAFSGYIFDETTGEYIPKGDALMDGFANVDMGSMLGVFTGKTDSDMMTILADALEGQKLSALFAGLEGIVGDKTFGNVIVTDPVTGKKNFDFEALLSDRFVGDLMGYTKGGCVLTHDHTQNKGADCKYTWLDQSGIAASGTQETIANISVSKLLDGSFQADDIISDLTIFDVLGDNVGTSGILFELKDTKISELSGAIQTLKIGKVIGLIERDGVWYESDGMTPADSLIGAIAGLTVDGLGGDSVMNAVQSVKLFDVLGLTEQGGVYGKIENGVFAPTSPILGSIAGLTVGELSGDALQSKLNNLTLKDVLPASTVFTGILASLKDTKIGDLSTSINGIKLATVLSVELYDAGRASNPNSSFDGVYGTYDASNVFTPSTALINKLAALSIEEMTPEKLNSILDNMKVKDFFTVNNGGAFGLLLSKNGDCTIQELPSVMTQVVTTATMGELMDAGLLQITDADQLILNSVFGNTWQDKTIGGFISALINALKVLPPAPASIASLSFAAVA